MYRIYLKSWEEHERSKRGLAAAKRMPFVIPSSIHSQCTSLSYPLSLTLTLPINTMWVPPHHSPLPKSPVPS